LLVHHNAKLEGFKNYFLLMSHVYGNSLSNNITRIIEKGL